MLCRVWPRPEDEERAAKEAREAIRLGRGRTMQDDLGFGLRQIVDIALRALSPGINDPASAQEAIVHLGGILRELLLRDLPATYHGDRRDRRLIRARELRHADYVHHAFAQIRRAGAVQPSVALALLDVLGQLKRRVEEAGLGERAEPLEREAAEVVAQVEDAGPLQADLERVRERARTEGLLTSAASQ